MLGFSNGSPSHFFYDPATLLQYLHLPSSSTIYSLIPIIMPLLCKTHSVSAALTDIPAHPLSMSHIKVTSLNSFLRSDGEQ